MIMGNVVTFNHSKKIIAKTLFLLWMITQICFAQWFWQNPIPSSNGLWGVSFTDVNIGTAVGDAGTILRTTDGGETWVNQSINKISWIGRISFTDANHGTAVGYDVLADSGLILRTTNGGQNWDIQICGTSSSLEGSSPS